MWCDNFDADLYKVVPEARAAISDVAGTELFTHCNSKDGQLNCPSQWNHYQGMLSFFGFNNPAKPEVYWTDEPIIRCTFEEAVRDAWVHGNIIFVERSIVWSGARWQQEMMRLMYRIRGINKLGATDAEFEQIKARLIRDLENAARRLKLVRRRVA